MTIRPTTIAVLALTTAMTVVAPVLAAPPMGNGNNSRIDCSLPTNANDPFCLQLRGHRPRGSGSADQSGTNGSNDTTKPGPANGSGSTGATTAGQIGGNGAATNNGPDNGPAFGGPGPRSGSFDWSRRDRDQFHQRFRGFDFGTFATPNFTIRLGIPVPHSYKLRHVPRSIYRYYPWFRGYLYFVDRRGDFVIVSPRSYKIVAVL